MPGPTIQDVLDRIDALDAKLDTKFAGIGIRQEYYAAIDELGVQVSGVYWKSQGFTPVNEHKVTAVRIKAYRQGSPGIVTVSIRATDGEGKPTGPDLCLGTVDGNSFTTSFPFGKWYSIFLDSSVLLLKDVQYAIVVSVIDGNTSNHIKWRGDLGGYPRGSRGDSQDSGSSWTLYSGDMMFEEYTNSSLSDLHRDILEINLKLPEARMG